MKKIFLNVNSKNVIGKIEPTIFGSFVEHLGRSIYDGFYEPNHPLADKNGFRQDVKDAVKELGVSIVRYPGGNFVSQYDWKMGIGPKENRKATLNLAWNEVEPNLVGIDDFVPLMEECGVEVMMVYNLGTGSYDDVNYLTQYCNVKSGTYWADQRIKNGNEKPFSIKYWGLGNEMDGEWQICHMPAEEYAKKALLSAQIAKAVDPNSKTIIAGSNSYYSPTFPEWDKTVLNIAYKYIDYLSIHIYFTYPDILNKNYTEFFGCYKDFEKYIQKSIEIINVINENKKEKKDVYLSLDEWNVWHALPNEKQHGDGLTYGNHLLENHYDYADSLVFTALLLTILNNVNYIKIACLAQLVNVIAPILTEKNGSLVKQTIYYPFSLLANSIKDFYSLNVDGDIPTFMTKKYGKAEGLIKNVSFDEKTSSYVISLLNLTDEEFNINFTFNQSLLLNKEVVLANHDFNDLNTFKHPNNVVPVTKIINKSVGDSFNYSLPKYSFVVLYAKKGE